MSSKETSVTQWLKSPEVVVAASAFAGGSYLLYKKPALAGEPSKWFKLLHVGTFATHFGSQFWVFFVGGNIMLKNLPRRVFGHLQSRIIPKFYLLSTTLGTVNMFTYLLNHPLGSWDDTAKVQVAMILTSLGLDIVNSLYLVPASNAAVFECHRYEKEVGLEDSAGMSAALDLCKKDPVYKKKWGYFMKVHGASAIFALFSFLAHGVQLFHIAKTLNTI